MATQKQIELITMGGAFIRAGKVYCIVHGNVEVTEDGDCDECHYVDMLVGAEVAEARAMQLGQEILENDDFFEPPELEATA